MNRRSLGRTLFRLTCLLPLLACGEADICPDCDPQMLHHLESSPPEELHRFLRDSGYRFATWHVGNLIRFPLEGPPPPHLEERLALAARIGEALRHSHGVEAIHDQHQVLRKLGPEGALEAMRLSRSRSLKAQNTELPMAARHQAIEEAIAFAEDAGLRRQILSFRMMMANLLAEQGVFDEQFELRESCLELARELGDPYLAAQLLGELGYMEIQRGNESRGVALYYDSLHLAQRHYLYEKEARIWNFLAAGALAEGDLGQGLLYQHQALEAARQGTRADAELLVLDRRLKLLEELGAEDALRRLSQRGRLLRGERDWGIGLGGNADYQFAVLDAPECLRLLRRGHRDEAQRLLESTCKVLRESGKQDHAAGLRLQFAELALAAGESGLAGSQAQAGLKTVQSMAAPPPALLSEGHLLAGELAATRGDAPALREALATVHRLWLDSGEWPGEHRIREAELVVRLAQLEGTPAGPAIDHALHAVEAYLQGLGTHALDYARLEALESLRDRLCRLAPGDALRYDFEMAWRTLPRRMGTPPRRWDVAPDAATVLRNWVAAQGPPAGAMLAGFSMVVPGVVHDLYRVTADSLLHWRWQDGGILHTARVRPLGDDAATWDPATLEPDAAGASLRLVTPDGPLRSLPFARLDPGTPILYARSLLPCDHPDGSSALVVADPQPAGDLLRRIPSLADLPAADLEVAAVRDRFPDATVLRGPDATKRGILGAWEGRTLIHLAAHVVADPEIPAVQFVPLSPGPGPGLSPNLSVGDVRSAELDACRLLVLSACRSGGFAAGGPSLLPTPADAALDAGVHAVVSTFGPVEDTVAAERMADLVADCPLDPVGLARAFHTAQREWRTSDPDGWADFAVSLGCLPAPALRDPR